MARGREPRLRPRVSVLRAQDEIMRRVGQNLHDVRLERRLTTHAVERRSGIRRDYLRYYEAGRVQITLPQLQRLATALECEVTELLGDRGGQKEARGARGRETTRIKGQESGGPPRGVA